MEGCRFIQPFLSVWKAHGVEIEKAREARKGVPPSERRLDGDAPDEPSDPFFGMTLDNLGTCGFNGCTLPFGHSPSSHSYERTPPELLTTSPDPPTRVCPECGGMREVEGGECTVCGGTGRVPELVLCACGNRESECDLSHKECHHPGCRVVTGKVNSDYCRKCRNK